VADDARKISAFVCPAGTLGGLWAAQMVSDCHAEDGNGHDRHDGSSSIQ
jgi:hypothetical protein